MPHTQSHQPKSPIETRLARAADVSRGRRGSTKMCWNVSVLGGVVFWEVVLRR